MPRIKSFGALAIRTVNIQWIFHIVDTTVTLCPFSLFTVILIHLMRKIFCTPWLTFEYLISINFDIKFKLNKYFLPLCAILLLFHCPIFARCWLFRYSILWLSVQLNGISHINHAVRLALTNWIVYICCCCIAMSVFVAEKKQENVFVAANRKLHFTVLNK